MKPDNLKYFSIIVVALSMLVSVGCEGPEGPQGETGPQGEQGLQGPQGPEGTANVIYSDWIAFNESDWSGPTSLGGETRREYPVSVTQLTEDILMMGMVAVYVRFDTELGRIFPLPLNLPLTTSREQHLDFELVLNTIIITFHDVDDNSVDPGTFGPVGQYRYILIPGETQAKMVLPDLSNYYETMVFYNIQP